MAQFQFYLSSKLLTVCECTALIRKDVNRGVFDTVRLNLQDYKAKATFRSVSNAFNFFFVEDQICAASRPLSTFH
jgi:hypothetical protein